MCVPGFGLCCKGSVYLVECRDKASGSPTVSDLADGDVRFGRGYLHLTVAPCDHHGGRLDLRTGNMSAVASAPIIAAARHDPDLDLGALLGRVPIIEVVERPRLALVEVC